MLNLLNTLRVCRLAFKT